MKSLLPSAPKINIPSPPPPTRLLSADNPELEKLRLARAKKRKGQGRAGTLLSDVTKQTAGGTLGGSTKLGA